MGVDFDKKKLLAGTTKIMVTLVMFINNECYIIITVTVTINKYHFIIFTGISVRFTLSNFR